MSAIVHVHVTSCELEYALFIDSTSTGGQSKPGELAAAVEVALKEGYRQIDCAYAYHNEAEIGEALQKCFKEGVVERENIFVTSKLGYGYVHCDL